MKTLIYGGRIVDSNRVFDGSLVLENGYITDIEEGTMIPHGNYNRKVDAMGCFVLPGIIDTHVHFRDPGLTHKADIGSESEAAAFGGVTSYFDMPNTIPQTTTIDAFDNKVAIAKKNSHVNYSFFFGATNDNIDELGTLDIHRIPGIKLFMGSSTGNMLVDNAVSLNKLFRNAVLPIMAHCEDTSVINANIIEAKLLFGEDPEIRQHSFIRNEDACFRSTALAVDLARKYGTRLHVAHVSTAKELQFFGLYDNITSEAVVAHLYFTDDDYSGLGSLIKCNPAIKTVNDRAALRKALMSGLISTVATDHAPHLLSEKQGGCLRAVSGMPMIQFSLVTMLELVDNGVLTIERMVELMCHNPARIFNVRDRGFIQTGYKADIVVVGRDRPWKVSENIIRSKCKWSPLLGHEYQWRVRKTFCNGHLIYDDGVFDTQSRGEQIMFR